MFEIRVNDDDQTQTLLFSRCEFTFCWNLWKCFLFEEEKKKFSLTINNLFRILFFIKFLYLILSVCFFVDLLSCNGNKKNMLNDYDTGIGSTTTLLSPLGSPQPCRSHVKTNGHFTTYMQVRDFLVFFDLFYGTWNACVRSELKLEVHGFNLKFFWSKKFAEFSSEIFFSKLIHLFWPKVSQSLNRQS